MLMQRLRATTKLLPYLSSADKGSSASSVVAHHRSLTKRPCFGTPPSSPSLTGFHKDSKDKVPHLIQAMPFLTSSSTVAQQAVPENEVEQVELLAAVEDLYGGVVVDVTEPMDSAVFTSLLQASLSQWRQKGKKGVWIKLPIERSNLVDAAVKEGFRYHHAESDYLMLVRWISETDDRLPANASHRVGIGAFVMNSKREVLVVQELSGRFRNTGVWKMPTGVVNEGEDICEAAVREVKEETGIDTEFVEVLAFRQSHKSFFRKSDLFIVCMLTPKSFDIQEQNLEIEAAQWMPAADYAAQPFVKKNKLFDYIAKICLAKSDKNYVGFTALGTTTSSGKRSYLYYNNRDMENLLATGDPQ
ncbi:nudix hydrolase 2-like isoform X1 [Pyrus x bretschneideri]|uniref:nudix hydrolase 2-like isoform X1 n=1 Tax=Pyrus x bretschneideri TaxID=225117 RepID=UPI0020300140|nr:nudix hydrolase 2-like isoform X1 [Pyrus x bretschneideri]